MESAALASARWSKVHICRALLASAIGWNWNNSSLQVGARSKIKFIDDGESGTRVVLVGFISISMGRVLDYYSEPQVVGAYNGMEALI